MYSCAEPTLGQYPADWAQEGPRVCLEGWLIHRPETVFPEAVADGAPPTTRAYEARSPYPLPNGTLYFPFGGLFSSTDTGQLREFLTFTAQRQDQDLASQELNHLLEWTVSQSGYAQWGIYVRVCGPTVVNSRGQQLLVIDEFEELTPPHERPPDPITVQGTLFRYTAPGTPNVWPALRGDDGSTWLVSSSRQFYTEGGYQFTQRWKAGTLTDGAEVSIHGYPLYDASPIQKLIPLDFTVFSRGEGEPDPGDIPFPDDPGPPPPHPEPPPFQPDPPPQAPPNGNGAPNGNGDLDDDVPPPNGAPPEDPDGELPPGYPPDGTGNGGPPPGNGEAPDGGGAAPPSTAGPRVRDLALASFVLFFLPSFLGDRGDKADWAMEG